VSLETGENDATLLLSSGAARYEMPLLAAEDYPSLPDMALPAVMFSRAVLLRALERTAFSTDRDSEYEARTVVRLEPDAAAGTMTLIATDIYRISVTPARWEQAHGKVPPAYIRGDFLQRWARAMKEGGGITVTLGFSVQDGSAAVAVLRDGSKEMTARCTTLPEYVNWQRASQMPDGDHLAVTADAAGLAAVVRRVGTILPEKSPVWLTFTEGEVKVATSRMEGRASGADIFPVTYDGPRFQIAFNARRLEEGLAAVGGTAAIVMTTPVKPAFLMRVPDSGEKEISFEDREFRHVIMPFGRSAEKPPE
jgi:DNA polymerase-3 subunit beta